ncbi:hypothetical protein SPF06_02565 [Sinomonas sp. JGH33]|uniref:SHOCT domain-containing protein n=1 Tax=Sinomonas terricola TaxID=3110330 RepID=A0ABU5T1S2_9MICC|nr:hypothetical protein [Sinomonas sp. JGH33]MEA5453595.1 hypothetical protein [Sinomonas sp. JGH33]
MARRHGSGSAGSAAADDGARRARATARAVVGGVAAAAGGVVAATLAAGIVMAPAQAPIARLGGIHDDLQRAVALRQITPEQAAMFEAKLEREILGPGSNTSSEA